MKKFFTALLALWRFRFARISLTARCPSCGHRAKHKIAHVIGTYAKDQTPQPFVRHTCSICDAPWFEPTVVQGSIWIAEKQPKIAQ